MLGLHLVLVTLDWRLTISIEEDKSDCYIPRAHWMSTKHWIWLCVWLIGPMRELTQEESSAAGRCCPHTASTEACTRPRPKHREPPSTRENTHRSYNEDTRTDTRCRTQHRQQQSKLIQAATHRPRTHIGHNNNPWRQDQETAFGSRSRQGKE